MKRQFLIKMLHYSGLLYFFLFLKKLIGKREAIILCYHRVMDMDDMDKFPLMHGVVDASVTSFDRQMKFLSRHFNVMNLSKLAEHYETGKLPKNTVVVTFDDGYKDNYAKAYPILKKHRLPATIFLTSDYISTKKLLWWDKIAYLIKHTSRSEIKISTDTGFHTFSISEAAGRRKACKGVIELLKTLEDPAKDEAIAELTDFCDDVDFADFANQSSMLSWEEVKEMSGTGVEFGAHSCTHPILTHLSREGIEAEVVSSKKKIEDILARPVETFAYPNGDYNDTCKDIVKNAGFRCACSYQYGLNAVESDVYALKRIAVSYDDDFIAFKSLVICPILVGVGKKKARSKKHYNWFLMGGSKKLMEIYLRHSKEHSRKARLIYMLLKIPGISLPVKPVFNFMEKSNPYINNFALSMYPAVKKHLLENWETILPDARKTPADLSCLMRERVRNIYFYFSSGDKDILFVKYIKNKKMEHLIEEEYENIAYLQKRLSGALKKSIPQICCFERVGGMYPVMILNHISGSKMSEILTNNSERDLVRADNNIRQAMRWLVEFQRQTETNRASISSLEPSIESLLHEYVSLPGAREDAAPADLFSKIKKLNNVEVPLVCSHGDWFPSNILIENGKMTVIDWADMQKGALPTNDLFTFFLSFRILPGKGGKANVFLNSFENVFFDGRRFSVLTQKYLNWYSLEMGFDKDMLKLLFLLYLLEKAVMEEYGLFAKQGIRRQNWTERLKFYTNHREELIPILR
ncbi:MAG: polysaccharide deacetylase family protein [Nitrospirae bacterium]|nr:polysaccharide deacetylase family protein [Nitrospirota bacterium]